MKLEEIMVEIPKPPGDLQTFEIQLPAKAVFRVGFQCVKQNEITGKADVTTRLVFAVDPDEPMEAIRFAFVLPNTALPDELVEHISYRGAMLVGHPAMPVPISIYSWTKAIDDKLAAETENKKRLRSIPNIETSSIADLDLSETP